MSQKSKKKPSVPGNTSGPKSTAMESRPAPAASAPVRALLGEDVEPQADTSATVPIWLVILLFLLVYWGMIHLDRSAGGFDEFVYGPYHSYKQLADLAPKSGPEMLIAKGEAVYSAVGCIACHQATGLGMPGQFPPLAGSEWAQGPANRVIRIPLHGLAGPITIKGQVWNAQMPPLGSLLDDESLAAVLTYVRQAWGNNAPPITPEQVKAIRAADASRTTQVTAEELLKIQ